MIVVVFVGHSYVFGIDPYFQIVSFKLSIFAPANIFHLILRNKLLRAPLSNFSLTNQTVSSFKGITFKVV